MAGWREIDLTFSWRRATKKCRQKEEGNIGIRTAREARLHGGLAAHFRGGQRLPARFNLAEEKKRSRTIALNGKTS